MNTGVYVLSCKYVVLSILFICMSSYAFVIDYDAINDYLSDTYGWLVIDWQIGARYEVYDHNDEVIDKKDDLQMAQISAEYDNAKFILDTETNEVVWGISY